MTNSLPVTATLPPMTFDVYMKIGRRLTQEWQTQRRVAAGGGRRGLLGIAIAATAIALLSAHYLDARLEVMIDALEWLAIFEGWSLALLTVGFLMILAGGILLVLQRSHRAMARWLADNMRALRDPVEAVFAPSGVQFRAPHVQTEFSWSAFTHLVDIPEGFALVADQMHVHYVDRQVPQSAEIRALAEKYAPHVRRVG